MQYPYARSEVPRSDISDDQCDNSTIVDPLSPDRSIMHDVSLLGRYTCENFFFGGEQSCICFGCECWDRAVLDRRDARRYAGAGNGLCVERRVVDGLLILDGRRGVCFTYLVDTVDNVLQFRCCRIWHTPALTPSFSRSTSLRGCVKLAMNFDGTSTYVL